MIVMVDYVTEREAAAIRFAYDGLGFWEENISDMTYRFKDEAGSFTLPRDTVLKFIDDWRRSGVWSLKGSDYETLLERPA